MSMTQQQALAMLELQNRMNLKVNPEWLHAGYPFLRAVVIEGGEGIEHHGWKWWKAQKPDMSQLRLELIDIWHFMLSDFIIKAKGNLPYAASAVVSAAKPHTGVTGAVCFDGVEYRFLDLDIVGKLELVIGLAVARRVSVSLFESLLVDCGMDWAELFRQYVAKNVLNMFRQDFGYKKDTYLKDWHGREDNEHLVELMGEFDPEMPEYKDRLYEGLRLRYATVQAKAAESACAGAQA